MTLNIWGTDPADINADEFCPLCEREVPHHYASCPTRKRDTCEAPVPHNRFTRQPRPPATCSEPATVLLAVNVNQRQEFCRRHADLIWKAVRA